MSLRNAFGDLAVESTANNSLQLQITLDREIMQEVLVQLKIMNAHLALINDEELDRNDVDMEHAT